MYYLINSLINFSFNVVQCLMLTPTWKFIDVLLRGGATVVSTTVLIKVILTSTFVSSRQNNVCFGLRCHKFAKCTNYDGEPKCNCRAGYVGDGKNCLRTSLSIISPMHLRLT